MNNSVRHRLRSLSRAYSRQRSTAPVALNLSLCARPPRRALLSATGLQVDLRACGERPLDVTFDMIKVR